MYKHTQHDFMNSTAAICARLDISRSTLERWERQGLIPKRQQLGLRKKGLLESVLTAWLETRASSSTPTN